MTRLEQILVGAYRDLSYWRAQTPTPPRGDRKDGAWHNTQCTRATRGEVACDVAKWIGKPQTAADRVSTSRAYKALAVRGLANPVSIGNRGHKTSLLAITAAGEDLARRLIAAADTTLAPEPQPPTAAAPLTSARAGEAATAGTNAAADTPPTHSAPLTSQPAADAEPIHEPTPEAAEFITDLDEALLYLASHEPAEPPYRLTIGATTPVSITMLSRLSYAGLVRITNSNGELFVETTATGARRAEKYLRDKATSAESTTTASQADTSSAAA